MLEGLNILLFELLYIRYSMSRAPGLKAERAHEQCVLFTN